MLVICCIYFSEYLRHVGASQHPQFQVRFDWAVPNLFLCFRVLVRILKYSLRSCIFKRISCVMGRQAY